VAAQLKLNIRAAGVCKPRRASHSPAASPDYHPTGEAMNTETQDQDHFETGEDFSALLAFAIIGTATTAWAFAVAGFAIWWSATL